METFDIEQINKLIQSRRSVFPKQYSDRKVEKYIIDQLLENANWAPNHGKTEPWRFFVFTGAALEKLGKYQAEVYKQSTPVENFLQAKYEKLLTNPSKASHVIAIVMQRQDSERIPEIEEIEAVACAVQNMHLTATAYGVGAYWSTGGLTYTEQGKEMLGLGEKDLLLGFFYVGYPEATIPEGKRKPVEEKTTWV
ncbi:nitroreductase [Rapidithrix thailandica]|uniref:Putative NAD(P)H nitroreductase n=1 Tax=Rapidithrix thailandica TaxID=413964 RepID=A0AAW9RYZ1_9BACT